MYYDKLLKKVKGIKIEVPDTNNISGEDMKYIRKEIFNMSRYAFSIAIGVPVDKIESWEKTDCRVDSSTQKLLYLLENNPRLIDQLYKINNEKDNSRISYSEIKNNLFKLKIALKKKNKD